jgi:uncharacterized protein (TIGR02996 family)
MSDREALLTAVFASPADDAPRLVYADWLDEHGQPERAEFIRVQCELARTDDPALRRRETELLAARLDALAGPLAAPHLRFRFERGWPVAFGHTGVFGSRRKSEAHSLLRFFPDGRYMKTHAVGQPARLAAYFEEDHPYLSTGTYELSGLDTPVRIQLKLANSRAWAYRGVFQGNSLTLAFGKKNKAAYSRESFSHVHIPGFDSFPET